MTGRFLNYVEIKTKITSIFALLMTLAYLFYTGQPINWKLTLVFSASMFLFDLTTTAINNYIDTKTNDQKLAFGRKTALIIIYILFLISAALGLYLVYLTDMAVLLLGGLCFLCGVLYTWGPVPISRQPLGELLSSIFYGFFIPLLLLYINMPEGTYFTYGLSRKTISLSVNVLPIITVILLSAVPVCVTANIMLANNICDVEKDIQVKRFTLPYYLGKKVSVYLFAFIYYAAYLAILIMVMSGILSPICLITLLTLVLVQKNINEFIKLQDKAVTFIVSIKNFVLIMGVFTLTIFVSGLGRLL